MTIECVPTSRWFGLILVFPALLLLAVGVLFLVVAGTDAVGLVIGTLSVGAGAGLTFVVARACLSPVTVTATAEALTLYAPAYFREAVTVPTEQLYGFFFGTRPRVGSASAQHTALVISLPRTNLGVRFTEDLYIREARPIWSAVVNNTLLHPRGNSTLVPAPDKTTRGILVRVHHPEETARALAQLMNVDTGPIW